MLTLKDNGGNVHKEVLDFLAQKAHYNWGYRDNETNSHPNVTPGDMPVVVLINERSLSDAEVTSNGIKALKLATIVGIFTPGLNYRTRCGEKVKILLNDVVGIKDPQEIEEEPAPQETPCVQEESKTEEIQEVQSNEEETQVEENPEIQETEAGANESDVKQEVQTNEETTSEDQTKENK